MRQRISNAAVELASVWGGLAALVLLGFVVAYQFVGAPPPTEIRIASGAVDGAYYAFAREYARLLAADGIAVEVVPTAGTVENLALLRGGTVTLALVQGGAATLDDRQHVQALGSLFLEPLWVFTPAAGGIRRLSDLRGASIAVGTVGSGTNRLATQVLSATGVSDANARLIHADAAQAAQLLSQRAVRAALLVASPSAGFVQELLHQPAVEIFAFDRAAAYSRRFPALTPVIVHEGLLDLERNIPARDTTVVAVASMLAARPDLNPGLLPAVLDAITRVHRLGSELDPPRRFPSVDYTDLPMNADAARYLTEGPSFLYRWLPYGTAVRLDRLKLLVVPLVALLIPLLRLAPPLYAWRIRSRIYRWYAQVRDVDLLLFEDAVGERTDTAVDRLRQLEREVASVTVPLAYAGELYHLRLHIRLLQERLERTRNR